jgi:hypothetical protein
MAAASRQAAGLGSRTLCDDVAVACCQCQCDRKKLLAVFMRQLVCYDILDTELINSTKLHFISQDIMLSSSIPLPPIFMVMLWTIQAVQCFTTLRPISITTLSTSSSTRLHMNYGRNIAKKNVKLPLLVDINNDLGYSVPLPNDHLPPELTTASLYQLDLAIPIHKSVIQDAVQTKGDSIDKQCCYGHVVSKPDQDSLIGAIGCASEILIATPASITSEEVLEERGEAERASDMFDTDDSGVLHVLSRGAFRFRVREVVSSIPYPIAIVDEVMDEDEEVQSSGNDNVDDQDEEDDDDDDDDDVYATLPAKTLIKQILQSLETILEKEVEATAKPLTPLEQSILETADTASPMMQAIQRQFDAEERLVNFQTFRTSLLDIASDPRDRAFCVAMMAAELANLDASTRVKMLETVNGTHRLRMVMRKLNSILAMDSARRVAKSLSLQGGGGDGDARDIKTDLKSLQEAENSKKELKVGTPQLPKWAGQISRGVRVEYFWSEEEGWCLGTVCEDPVKVLDELVISVKFDDDGSIHKLPLRGEDKARWRPPMGDTGAFD